MHNVIEIENGVTRHPLYRMNKPVNLSIADKEQIAIIGNNGSGKSRLVDIIIGKYPLLLNEVHYDFTPSPFKLVSENIKYI
ncbi:MAG: ATP-binding cassette domain-containing protein, partial [Paraprevotella sp.]|nr:ATP-binding cassette domain-containing protein [Paraprevotella sp.]